MEDTCDAKNNARLDQVMKDFKKVIVDMTRDILTTFPERFNTTNLNEHLKNVFENTDDENDTSLKSVFEHCKKVYPDKFFNILYQNDCIFTPEDINESEFLPGIIFEELWKDPLLSDKSREVIWKYLQLVLFTIISTINNKESFGESAKMFENINEDEFKNKLEEAMEQIQNIFNFNKSKEGEEGTEGASEADQGEGINLGDMPNPQDIHDHVTGMLDGKLGKLAREIAEETAADLNMDMNNTSSVNDVFKNLMKNPTKLMGIVKNVGNKLDEKMKSGDIKESELLKEAGDIMDKMKNIPGMGNIQSMMEKMGMGMGGAGGGGAGGMADMMSSMAGMMGGMGGGGKGKGKVNMNAFQNYMKKGAKAEGMKARLAERQAQAQQQAQAHATSGQAQQQAQAHATSGVAQQPSLGTFTKVDDTLVYSTGEKVERSLVPPTSSSSSLSGEGIKKKKKNKNKNKNKKTTEE